MSSYVVEVENLSVTFDGHESLIDVNIKIPQNEFVAIVGPNGGLLDSNLQFVKETTKIMDVSKFLFQGCKKINI